MTMKKALDSQGMIVVGETEIDKMFPVSFQYRIGTIIYTVKGIVKKDPHSDMRRVITSAGDEEFLTIETIKKDLKDADASILCEGTIETIDKKSKSEEIKDVKTEEKKEEDEKNG